MRFLTLFSFALVSSVNLMAEPVALFDGKTFEGWEGNTETVWRIEDEAFVAGSLTERQEKNDFIATEKEFENFDLSLKWKLEGTEGFVNGGVQFRSQRIPNHHEVIGYQADLGKGYDGALYDESRRKRMLAQPSEEVLKQAMKPLGEWNDYRIRAEGPRIQIWLNGVQTVDYTEEEAGIARKGMIAVQIHGNATSIVRYKELVIEELPASENSGAEVGFELGNDETIALAGGSNIERTRFNGYLQTHLIAAKPESTVRVRNFGWEGDTVYEQWRDDGDLDRLDERRRAAEKRNQQRNGGTSWRQQRDWRQQLSEVEATVVIAQFGQMEALDGVKVLPVFLAAYERLIEEFADEGRRVVLVSPMPFEETKAPLRPDLTEHNAAVAAYAHGIRELANRLDHQFIDLSLMPPGEKSLTDNGYQLNEWGHRVVAARIAEGLGLETKPDSELAALREEVLEFERLWFDYWRPMNWAFLSGDRTTQPYSKDWKDSSQRIFPKEMEDFLPLLEQAQDNIRAVLAGTPTDPIGVRSSIPVEQPSAPPQSPDEELASFQIQDGFEVNLFASEADGIINPIQMRWDERGRLWVACTISYPQIKPGEKANDYVLVCEDTDGDGRADQFHKFVEGLFMPSGLELGDGGLYVAQGTELLHFKDTDGDGKADEERIVLGGFGTADSHQMINGINWGFGGELWFTQGHHIYSRVETPYGVETLNRAGVWRFRPHTGHLDPFFQWSSAGANCWGVVTTNYGQPFHKSGANIGAYYSTPGLIRSDLAVNAKAMNLCLAPIKQVGMEFLGSSHFPKEMQGRVVIGGYYANLLEWHQLNFKNGMFSTELLPNLIETTNNVFRPVEVRCGPDGALYVADWYNPIIGHYQASYRHPDRDKAHGRIWRVTCEGRPLVKPANLANASISELLEQLDSPERWAMYQAKRLLFERDREEVLSALADWLPEQDSEYRRLQALSLYEAHEAPQPELLKQLLKAEDLRVRAYATRVIGTWAREGRISEGLGLIEQQIADEDPLVRLEAIVAASYFGEARAAAVAARALDADFNEYHQHALTKTLHAMHALWAPKLVSGKFQFDRDEHLIFALQNGWVDNTPEELRVIAAASASDRARDLKANAGGMSRKVAGIVRKQVLQHGDDEARQVVWLKLLAEMATGEDVPFVLKHGGDLPQVLAKLTSSGTRPENAEGVLRPLFESSSEGLRLQAVRLAGLWKAEGYADRLRALALDAEASLALRRTAVGSLRERAALQGILNDSNSKALHAVALQTLIQVAPRSAAEPILARLRGVESAESAAVFLRAVLGSGPGGRALQEALKQPEALPATTAKWVLQGLNEMGRSDDVLSPLLMELAGINSELPAYTKAQVTNLVKAATTHGNAAEGKKVYEKAGCIACHMPGAPGSKIGPDLSAISRGLPIDMIVTEVVWPSLNVKEGYEAASVTLKDGSVVAGFKDTDTAEAIAIRDMATGEVRSITKSDAQQIQTGGTVMPDGMTAGLDERELAHLIRYLSELGQ